MSLYELITARRTIRQFKSEPLPRDILERLVNAARLAPSAANLQPLEFIVVDKEELKKQLFPCLKWAAYIAPEGNPKPGHEPVAYIVILINSQVREKGYEYDAGAAIENMILTAWELGVGSCWLLSVERNEIQKILEIPASYNIDSVLALGYPDESPLEEEMEDSIKYWKDGDGRLHVPKRKLKDIIHFNRF
ncbi:MAG: nitroreductase family protein [Candidatus Aminicenantes bacterium]|nr:MAG: nitroreductase family protein [Candidatus Aminicenantes bacterium]